METDFDEFRNRVKLDLDRLSKKQIVHFAWRCAVRTIPFIGAAGNFNFWKEENRQKYLYSIFYALDLCNATITNKNIPSVLLKNTIDSVLLVVNAVDYTDSTSAAATATVAAVDSASAETIPSAVEAALSAAYAFVYASDQDFEDIAYIISHDLDIIKTGRIDGHKSIKIYHASLLSNFKESLKNEGCLYWWKLYTDILNTDFFIDQRILQRRLNVPIEIKEQGAASVGNYLEELEKKGARRLNEARIIILGDKGAGKTCLARRLVNPKAQMTTDDESTAGVDTYIWELEDEDINVRIWDFAGHTVTHAVHQFFLSERCLYILVYNSRTEDIERLEYWLNHMKNYGGDSEAIILVNKRDHHTVNIPINNLKEQYSIANNYDFSIKNDFEKLQIFRKDVTAYIRNHPSWNKQEIPQSYYNVKEELEYLFASNDINNGREHIRKEFFIDIAQKYQVENIDKLLKDLHFLGVSLWYEEMSKYNTLVLNPEWISQGVYRIINWVNEEKKHNITLKELSTVFEGNEDRYPAGKHQFLFDLMKHYELAYETKKGSELVIPHLLKEDRPTILPDFFLWSSLMLRYKSEQPLPPNTISRFIVRHNQEIKKERNKFLVWRYGVVLENIGCIAMVREEDRTISVTVKGNDNTSYLSKLRATLNDIFENYKSDKPELEYRIERFGRITEKIEEKEPLWLSQRKIVNHHSRNIPYYDDITDQNIPMGNVYNNYNISAENAILGSEGFSITKNTFNFQDCNISLQGNLNELANQLAKTGNNEEANELQEAAEALEQAEELQDKKEVKKKGILNSVRRFLNDLEDENSKFHKTVKGVKNGISIAQDIAKGYNDIAQWAGLPQVPRPFLKKE